MNVLTPKQCASCREEKPLSAFGRHRVKRLSGYVVRLYPYCKPCRVQRNLADKRKHFTRARAAERRSKLKLNYGITPEEYAAQLDLQLGLCAVCGASLAGRSPQSVHVDHCHASGRLRGILCGPCNTGLGAFRDDPMRLRAAQEYLAAGGVWNSAGGGVTC